MPGTFSPESISLPVLKLLFFCNGATVEVYEWISHFIPHFTGCVITAAFTLYATRRDATQRNATRLGRMIGFQWNQQDRSHYARRDATRRHATPSPELAPVPKLSRVYTIRDATRRDAIWRDIQVLFTLCATSSRAVTWQQGIWDPEQIKLGNLNGCFDPTWHCVYLTDIPPKITSIRITQPHKHITWNTNSSHWWVLIKVCWGFNPGCVNSTSHATLNQAS